MNLPSEFLSIYEKQHYRVVGRHSAVKKCMWVGKSLKTSGTDHCYKQRFYGVPCHRCLQMTPSLGRCTQSCVFCWRATPEMIGVGWDQKIPISGDNPEDIVDGCITAHRKLIYGYGGSPNISHTMLDEALNPVHVAISLEGEPTLYTRLSDLVGAYKNRGFRSVFIVTNGTKPEVLKKLEVEPSQLYVSICAPDEETYAKTCRPLIPRAWERLNETVDLLQSFTCPTVLRHTLAPTLNMHNIDGYARISERANPTYIEAKGAMSVGFARRRFKYSEMARHTDIQRFAFELSKKSGYNVIDEQSQSNVVLLSRLEKALNLYA